MLECSFNKGVWDSFSESDRVLVEACCRAENNLTTSEFNARNGDALDQLVNQHGVQVREYPDEVFKSLAEASEEVLADMAAESALVDRIYNSFYDFRTKAMDWTAIAEQGFANKRRMALG